MHPSIVGGDFLGLFWGFFCGELVPEYAGEIAVFCANYDILLLGSV